MKITQTIASQLEKTRQTFGELLTDPHFYLEILLIGVALAVAVMMAYLIRRQILRLAAGAEKPLKLIPRLLRFTTPLLEPLLAIIYLSVARPMALEYAESDILTAGTLQLSIAWLAVRLVFATVSTRGVAWLMAAVIWATALLSVTNLLDPVNTVLAGMDFSFGKYKLSMLGIMQGVISFIIVFWLASTLSNQLEHYLRHNSRMSYNARELIAKFFRIIVYFIAFIITLDTAGIDLTAFAIFGGALGVGAGLGLQKITANFVSGVILLLEKSIKIGDLVEVGPSTGWVRSLNMRYALIETAEGREVLVPNDDLINTRVTNWTYSSDAARIEILAKITYDSDAKKARELMLAAARAHPKCAKDPKPSCFLREFTETGVTLQLTFWVDSVRDGRLGPQSEVMFDILERFEQAHIAFSNDPNRKKADPVPTPDTAQAVQEQNESAAP